MPHSIEPLRIRPASNADVLAVREVVFSVLREYGLEPHASGTDADLADIEASYLRAGGLFEVIQEPDGRIVGTVGLCPLSPEQAELRKMYLLRELRGRGLGRLLLERMLDGARRLGFREVVLETNSVLKEAVGLYRAYGFVPTDRAEKSPRCDQVYLLRLDGGL